MLSQRPVQILSFLGIFLLTSIASSQETEDKRAVTEHQFMHDKGKGVQELKRLMWLHNTMGGVHTAGGRDLSHMNSIWDVQKAKDTPNQHNSGNWAEDRDMMKQLLIGMIREQTFPLLKANEGPLHLLKNSNMQPEKHSCPVSGEREHNQVKKK
nr:PREDICTED: parathyroid hormone-related protein-like [Latimeria chalumnae]|eukprot:XP_005987745.1 PREDICTED: parathyroid hormone-related protein-like [Latimeria chalumnae]